MSPWVMMVVAGAVLGLVLLFGLLVVALDREQVRDGRDGTERDRITLL